MKRFRGMVTVALGLEMELVYSHILTLECASESPGGLVTTQIARSHPELMIQFVFREV